jgi:pimeloyl-ACP methyl ester carboxylesterase
LTPGRHRESKPQHVEVAESNKKESEMCLRCVFSWLLVLCLTACQSTPDAGLITTPKRVQINGAELSYVEQGTGVVVLFVHGAGQDWRAFGAMRPFIASKYRYISLNRRYHHPNAWPDDGRTYSIDQNVEDIAAFIRQLNVGKVHLVGNSFGGRIVGYVAVRYPDLLRSVVLGEASLLPPESSDGKAAVASYQSDLGKARAAALAGNDIMSAELVISAILADPNAIESLSPDSKSAVVDNAKTMGPMFKGAPPGALTCQNLKELKVPALVVRGEKTRDAFRFGNEQMLKCLPPTTQSVVVPNARHIWALDNPPAAANEILAFLSNH